MITTCTSNLLKSPTEINEITAQHSTAQHSTAQSLIKPKFRAFILPALLLFGSCLIQLRADDQLSNLEAAITYSENAEESANEAVVAADAAQVYASDLIETANDSAANVIDDPSDQAMAQFLADAEAAQAAQTQADLALQAATEAQAAANAAAQAALDVQVAADAQTIADALAAAEAAALEGAMAAADAQAAADAAAALASYEWQAEQNAILNANTELMDAQNEAARLQSIADAESSAAIPFAYEQMLRENQVAYEAQLDALAAFAYTFPIPESSYTVPETSDSYLAANGDNLSTLIESSETIDYLDPAQNSAIDSDGDGLTDSVELTVYFTNPAVMDSDGDGLDDAVELFVTLSDPNDPNDPGSANPTASPDSSYEPVAPSMEGDGQPPAVEETNPEPPCPIEEENYDPDDLPWYEDLWNWAESVIGNILGEIIPTYNHDIIKNGPELYESLDNMSDHLDAVEGAHEDADNGWFSTP